MSLVEGKGLSELALNCIKKCLYCYVTCRRTYQDCAGHENRRQALLDGMSLLECAQICRTTETFIRRRSEFWDTACTLCAEACEKCARACLRVTEDEQLIICSEACADCAAICRELVRDSRVSSHRISDSEVWAEFGPDDSLLSTP